MLFSYYRCNSYWPEKARMFNTKCGKGHTGINEYGKHFISEEQMEISTFIKFTAEHLFLQFLI
jgi:hypothetical protein